MYRRRASPVCWRNPVSPIASCTRIAPSFDQVLTPHERSLWFPVSPNLRLKFETSHRRKGCPSFHSEGHIQNSTPVRVPVSEQHGTSSWVAQRSHFQFEGQVHRLDRIVVS